MRKKLEYAQNAALNRLTKMDVEKMSSRDLSDYFNLLMIAESMINTHEGFERLNGLCRVINKEA